MGNPQANIPGRYERAIDELRQTAMHVGYDVQYFPDMYRTVSRPGHIEMTSLV